MKARAPDLDVAIVGAGPAGASAAIRLARAGRRVVLIDRQRFPREKCCGGCLSGRTVGMLRELLGTDDLPGVAGTEVTFVMGRYRLRCRSAGQTRVVRRAELDARLVDEALAAGAEGLFGETAEVGIDEVRPVVEGRLNFQVWIGNRRIRTKVVLMATGLSRSADTFEIMEGPEGRQMLAQQWAQPYVPGMPEVGAVEMHWLRGGYVGLASPAAGECVIALAADVPERAAERPLERLRRLNPDSALWNAVAADAPRLFAARGAAGFPWKPRRLGYGNVLLIGDAAGYEEPYTGEGIGQALCSAWCAATAILEAAPHGSVPSQHGQAALAQTGRQDEHGEGRERSVRPGFVDSNELWGKEGGRRGWGVLRRYTRLMRRYHRPVVRRTRWISRVLQAPVLGWLASRRPVLPESLLARLVKRVHVKGVI